MASKVSLKDVMTPFPHSVDLQVPLVEARRLMRSKNIRHLPVTRQGSLVGILTDRDIKLVLGPDFDYPSPRELTVNDAYAEPYMADEDTPLTEVLNEMVKRHIGSAIATRKGHLAGVFTAVDACRELALRVASNPD